jgi:hypothetical protein
MTDIHPQAALVLVLVKMLPNVGRQATYRRCQALGVPTGLYTIARVLDAARRAGL